MFEKVSLFDMPEFNRLAIYEKYPVLNTDNLTIPIHMQLSEKEKIYSQFFAAFLKYRLNFEHFDKKRWRSQLLYFRNYGL